MTDLTDNEMRATLEAIPLIKRFKDSLASLIESKSLGTIRAELQCPACHLRRGLSISTRAVDDKPYVVAVCRKSNCVRYDEYSYTKSLTTNSNDKENQ